MVYVGFSASPSWISRLIRWATASEVSHAFVVFDWLGTQWVLEADLVGVRMVSLNYFCEKNTVVALLPLPIDVDNEVMLPALAKLGRRYDFGGLFGSAWVLLGRWLRLHWHNPLQSGRALFCSELVVEDLLKPMHYPGAEALTPGDTNPEDLRRFLRGE